MKNLEYAKIIIDTAYGPLSVRVSGSPDSEIVIAVHGWSQRNGWHTWAPLMTPLSDAGLFVVSLDMPGWGDSPAWTDGPLNVDYAVAALAQVSDHFGKEQVVIMGKSWGGGIGLQYAIDYPKRVSKLILSAPGFRNFESLTELSQPVLLVWAEDDPVIAFRHSAKFLDRIPEVTLMSFKSGGHSAAPKNSEVFAPAAVQFILSSSKAID